MRKTRTRVDIMPPRLSDLQVNRITNRLTEGDPPKLISETENINLATVYRLKRNIQTFATPYPDSMFHLGRPKKNDSRDRRSTARVSSRKT